MPDAIRLPSFRLDDRVAMVTGSGTGIGAGIASGFAEAGADLVLVGRTLGPLEATAQRVQSFGRKATIIVCDLTDRTGLRRHIASLPRLDILVNNAGTSIPEPILDVTDASLDTMFGLNVTRMVAATVERLDRIRAIGTPFAKTVADLVEFYRSALHKVYGLEGASIHDPLAAAVIFAPDLCQTTRGTVSVWANDDALSGLTRWQREPDGAHEIAASVDAERFFAHYFAVTSPSPTPPPPPSSE